VGGITPRDRRNNRNNRNNPEQPEQSIGKLGDCLRSALTAPRNSDNSDPEPVAGLREQTPPAAPPPLTPEQENARLRKILDDSGPAAGDALDRSSHGIANDLVVQLRAHDVAVDLQSLDCRAAGCTATLEIAAEADHGRARDLLQGIDPRSPVARWPGPRIMPPPVHRDGKLVITVMMIRPDSTARFQ